MAMSVVYTTVNGQILRENRGGVVSDFVPDPLGSVVMVQDSAGAAVYRAEYDPYGNVQSETGTNPSSLGYVGTLGYIKDSATSMYVRARYLLNNLGRWLTKDPLWPSEAGYVYANAAPSMWVDSSGTSPSFMYWVVCQADPNPGPGIPPCAQLQGVNGMCAAALCSAKTTLEIVLAFVSGWKGLTAPIKEAIKQFRKSIKKGQKVNQQKCCQEAQKQLKSPGGSLPNPLTLGGLFAFICSMNSGKFPVWQFCHHSERQNGGTRDTCDSCCTDMFKDGSDDWWRCKNECNRII